jgi:DNA-nicking Smr family endonuclease
VSLIDRVLGLLLAGAARALPGGVPVLDLHGLGVQDAVAATERFIADAVVAGAREVRIIYGKGRNSPGGRGVLCEVIPRWLASSAAVDTAVPEPDASGADGAIRVRLRREG